MSAKFVVYGKGPGLMYSVRTADGHAICTCAYNTSNKTDDREAWAAFIVDALNVYTAAIAKAPEAAS